jgi:NAD(P)-dependent dehydrogenase (short-subunit alcohol dehydrogenase family)
VDALLGAQTPQGLWTVLAPKLAGTLNLGLYTLAAEPVASLVLFSSIAALLGNVGQSNYAAANACLDGLAETHSRQVSITTLLLYLAIVTSP